MLLTAGGPLPHLQQQMTGTWKYSYMKTQAVRIFGKVMKSAESKRGFEELSAISSAGFEERRNEQVN
jgi:hypothetical protein